MVLNRSWVPIATITVRRAWSLLYRESARVIDPKSYAIHDWRSWIERPVVPGLACTRTTVGSIPNPEVILLRIHDRIPVRSVPFSRRNVYRRDQHRCQYCGATARGSEASLDHIVPQARGGRSSFQNCVLACVPCNLRKGSRTPAQAQMTLLRQPSAPHWSPWQSLSLVQRRPSWRRFVPALDTEAWGLTGEEELDASLPAAGGSGR